MRFLRSFLIAFTAVLVLRSSADALVPDERSTSDSETLKLFFIILSGETKSEDIDALAKEYGLYASYRNYGTGTYGYRIAASKDIADVSTKAKGSYVSISFYILQDDAVTEISCFNSDTMTEAFWYPDHGYSVIDYNLPQIVVSPAAEDGTKKRTCMMPVASAVEAVDYVSTGSPDGNLLAQLFLSAYEGMTEAEILSFVQDNSLAYSLNGPGNFRTIAYTEDVSEKYGKNGSVITFDTNEAGLIWMQYSYYPTVYSQDISAAFYSRAYAASQKLDEGFLICRAGSKPAQYKDPVRLVELIHGQIVRDNTAK